MDSEFLKQVILDANACAMAGYKAGMEAGTGQAMRQIAAGDTVTPPAAGEWAVQENARLRDENAELRRLLQDVVLQRYGSVPGGGCVKVRGVLGVTHGLESAIRAARAALAKVAA
jgi:hypothetical protein